MAKLAASIDYGIIRNEYVDFIHWRWKRRSSAFCIILSNHFLNDRPLANLIGHERNWHGANGVREPEDGIASLFDMMAGLIRSDYGRAFSVAEQQNICKAY